MKQCFFAVDLGATSGRTILGTFTSNGLEMEEVNRFPNHLIEAGRHFYWDIYELYRHIIEGLRIAARKGVEITSIGIDTWGVDFVCVGKDGGFLRQPYSYRDPHTVGAPEAFFTRIPRSHVYGWTGIQVMNFNSLFQLDTLRRNHDSALAAADKLLFMPDALSYMLTGQMVTEYTIASTAQLVNANTCRLEDALLQEIGLTQAHFGRFVYPGEKIGGLTEEVQRITGLGAVPVIAVAGHDTASAVAAVPARDEHFAYLSSGTWSLMGIETEEPIITEESYKNNFTNEGGIEGTTRFLKNITGMWLLEQCRKEWEKAGRAYAYSEIVELAGQAVPFVRFVDPDDPRFANPTCMTKAIAGYCEETGQPVPETDADFIRCIFESLALRYNEVIRMLKGMAPFQIDRLHVIGGGSKNNLLNQFTANAIGMPVIAGPSEATAIGNGMVQARSAGIVSTRWEMRQLIADSIQTETFLPQDETVWKDVYDRYLQVVKR